MPIGAVRRLEGAEWTEIAVIAVHTHLSRRVARALPELDVRFERPPVGVHEHLALARVRRALAPRTACTTLYDVC